MIELNYERGPDGIYEHICKLRTEEKRSLIFKNF